MSIAPTSNANTIGLKSVQNGHNHTMMYSMKRGNQHSCLKDSSFRVPLHYPRYSKAEYEDMPEWKLDHLLAEYGLPVIGDVHQRREFAIGTFLWPAQVHDH